MRIIKIRSKISFIYIFLLIFSSHLEAQLLIFPAGEKKVNFPPCQEPTKEQIENAIKNSEATIGRFFKDFKETGIFSRLWRKKEFQVLVSRQMASNEYSFAWATVSGFISDSFSAKISIILGDQEKSVFKVGEEIEGKIEQIYDWRINYSNLIYGSFLVRERISNCSPPDRDKYLEIYSEKPTPWDK